MSTTIEHACGHTIKHAETYSDWFTERLEERPCVDCFRAQYKAEVEAARAASVGLPVLKGTEKQVAWATKIRAEIIANFPAVRELARRYAGESRFWIDMREMPEVCQNKLVLAALKAEDELTLVRASAVALRARLLAPPRQTRLRDAEQPVAAAVLSLTDHPPYAWRVIVMIGANPQLFVELATADGDDAPAGALATQRGDILRQIDEECVKCDRHLASERARLAAEAERAAEQKRIEAERAAAWRAHEAELERRRAPVLNALPTFPWEGSDGYWAKRLRDHVLAMGWPEIDAYPRAVEAMRVLAALPDRTALKAIERLHPTRVFDTVLDAQQLAALVGASEARAMHVAAGLPKPVIRKAKVATHG